MINRTQVNNCYSELIFQVFVSFEDATINSLNSLDLSQLNVFPNPTNEWVHINYTETISNVKLVNQVGQIVYTNQPNTNQLKINIGHLSKGLYILEIQSDLKSSSIKVLISN